jgi:hypothetical protein
MRSNCLSDAGGSRSTESGEKCTAHPLAQHALHALDVSVRLPRVRAFAIAALNEEATGRGAAGMVDRLVKRLLVAPCVCGLLLLHERRRPSVHVRPVVERRVPIRLPGHCSATERGS